MEILQRFVLPGSRQGLALHVRAERGELVFEDELLRSTPHARLSFDTQLNSFHEAYWVAHTAVERLELVLEGKGRVWCAVYREVPSAGVKIVTRELLDLDAGGEASLALELRQMGHGDPGRLFATLEADGAGLALNRIAWATPDPPLRAVSLGVGICTSDREHFLARTLERLLKAGPEACIDEVLVVNQGEPLQSAWLANLRTQEPSRLRVLEQEDFAGAGGFARAALELLKTPTTSHVFFMDDDVEVEPSQLPTAAAFLRYSRARLVLGGQMLDLLNRRDAVADAAPLSSAPGTSGHEGLDLRARETLQTLAQVALSNFNGWWFAAVPAEAFRTYGLPLPIFIRGDDMEFGIRLRRAGIPTVSLPPASHEPFYDGPAGLKHYYDLRNRLIFASLHPEHAQLERPGRLARLVFAMLARDDYQHIAIIREALRDFLLGPDLLESPAGTDLASVLTRLPPSATDGRRNARQSWSLRRGWAALAGVLPVILRYCGRRHEAAALWRAASVAMAPSEARFAERRPGSGGWPC